MGRRSWLERAPLLLLTAGATVAIAAPYGVLAVLEALAVEAGIEAVLVAAGVALVVAVEALLLRLPEDLARMCIPARTSTAHSEQSTHAGRVVGGERVRGPPVPTLP